MIKSVIEKNNLPDNHYFLKNDIERLSFLEHKHLNHHLKQFNSMSFFDKIFGGKEDKPEQKLFWKKIQSEQDLAKAIENSYHHKIGIFKHSTSCFISKTVLKNFEREIENSDMKVDFYYLDLLAYRPISNKIAEDFGIRHESPQLIVIENGKALNNASHQDISITQVTNEEY